MDIQFSVDKYEHNYWFIKPSFREVNKDRNTYNKIIAHHPILASSKNINLKVCPINIDSID